jgi:Fur family transcriptional regulator, ferric uptake regulator
MIPSPIEQLCIKKGIRMTGQRRIIARVLSQAQDHPDVEVLTRRVNAVDGRISMSTVYRTLKVLEDAGIIEKRGFKDGRARYEPASRKHHDHLLDLHSGDVVEFHSPELEALQEKIAKKLGFQLVDHRLELYGMPLSKSK